MIDGFNKLADKESLEKTIKALGEKNFIPIVLKNKKEALSKIKELIPSGASVMNGASVTLEQIGYIEYLKSGKHSWSNLHAQILAENDKEKRGELRKRSVLSDYYLGSVHAVSEEGELLIGSNSGSQLPHLVFTSPNLILVVSTKKIVSSLDEAMKRLEEYVIPLEEARMQAATGSGTELNKIVILKKEPSFSGRKIYILLVKEDLGF